jgi:hypothetical protein
MRVCLWHWLVQIQQNQENGDTAVIRESELEVEFQSSKGTVVWPEVEEELEVGLWRLSVWLEDLVIVRLIIPLPGYD